MRDKVAEPKSPRFAALAAVFALLYFVQGITEPTEGLIAQPMRSVLRDSGHSPAEVSLFAALISVPWMLKPLFGLLTDFVPFRGTRRRGYLLLAMGLTSVSLLLLGGLFSPGWPIGLLTIAVLVPTAAVAFSDVVIDAVMIEEGRPRGWTGRLQSVQWTAYSLAGMAAGLAGGWVSQLNIEHWGLAACGLLAGLAWLVVWLGVREPPRPIAEGPGEIANPRSFREAVASLVDTCRDPVLQRIAVFLLLWNFNPFATTVLQEHLTRALGWSESAYGEVLAWHSVGFVAGSALYGLVGRGLGPMSLFHGSIATGVVSTLAYTLLTTPESAPAISIVVGTTYMFGTLAQLDLAARMCHPATAGTTFSILMAVSNASVALSMLAGGALYERISQREGEATAYFSLVVLGSLATAACWLLTPTFRRATSGVAADDGEKGTA